MTEQSESQPIRWLGPTVAWAVILCATAGVAWVGFNGSGGYQFAGALALAALMLGTLAFGLVGVGRNPALLQLIACAAFLFLALLFFLSFADLVTRLK